MNAAYYDLLLQRMAEVGIGLEEAFGPNRRARWPEIVRWDDELKARFNSSVSLAGFNSCFRLLFRRGLTYLRFLG